METVLNTLIVLRNDHGKDVKFGQASSNVILQPGELGIHYLDNGNIIVKSGDGETAWADLPQVESVLENDILLTHSFGKHSVPAGSYKNAGGKNMTFSQWFQEALKSTINPVVVQPNAELSASIINKGDNLEVGSYIEQISYNGTSSNGSYKVNNASDQGTGISASSFTWLVELGSLSSNQKSGSFTLTNDPKLQITSDSKLPYGTITAKVALDTSTAKNPKNNLGEDVPELKISKTSVASNGFSLVDGVPTKSLEAKVEATGFHKAFWGVIASTSEIKSVLDYQSSDVRNLPNSSQVTKGFPLSLAVPAGSQQVVFFAKAGAYNTISATDDKAMNAPVSFTKVSNALKVTGNNGYKPEGEEGFDYDLWYVDWGAGIGTPKQLSLKWS